MWLEEKRMTRIYVFGFNIFCNALWGATKTDFPNVCAETWPYRSSPFAHGNPKEKYGEMFILNLREGAAVLRFLGVIARKLLLFAARSLSPGRRRAAFIVEILAKRICPLSAVRHLGSVICSPYDVAAKKIPKNSIAKFDARNAAQMFVDLTAIRMFRTGNETRAI